MKAVIYDIQKFSIHDGPGIRTVVFFKGCPLQCAWCSNPESQSFHPQTMLNGESTDEIPEISGQYMTIDDIMAEVTKDIDFYEESGGGVTLSGGEVLSQSDFARKLLQTLRQKQIHTAIETTGFSPFDTFKQVAQLSDLLLFDLKHHDSAIHQKFTGVPNEQILVNMKWAVSNEIPLTARIPVIPGFNDKLADAAAFTTLLIELGIKDVNLLPFHQFGMKKYDRLQKTYQMKNVKPIHSEDLQEYLKLFQNAGLSVQI